MAKDTSLPRVLGARVSNVGVYQLRALADVASFWYPAFAYLLPSLQDRLETEAVQHPSRKTLAVVPVTPFHGLSDVQSL